MSQQDQQLQLASKGLPQAATCLPRLSLCGSQNMQLHTAAGSNVSCAVVCRFQTATCMHTLYGVPAPTCARRKDTQHPGLTCIISSSSPARAYQCAPSLSSTAAAGKSSPVVSFTSGAVAGAAATVASYPFDLLRTTLAAQGEPKVRGISIQSRTLHSLMEGREGCWSPLCPVWSRAVLHSPLPTALESCCLLHVYVFWGVLQAVASEYTHSTGWSTATEQLVMQATKEIVT